MVATALTKQVFLSTHSPPRYVVVEVRASRIYVKQGIVGVRGAEGAPRQFPTPLAARLAISKVAKTVLADLPGGRTYKQDYSLDATDVPRAESDLLSEALADHPTVLRHLKKMTPWKYRAEMKAEKPPTKRAKSWRPKARFAVVRGDIELAGNLITGAPDCDDSVLVVVGAVRAENLMNSAGAVVYVVGPLEVRGLAFLATPDSELTTFGPVTIGVLDEGRGKGTLTTRAKPVRVGTKKRVFDEERALERFEETTKLV